MDVLFEDDVDLSVDKCCGGYLDGGADNGGPMIVVAGEVEFTKDDQGVLS